LQESSADTSQEPSSKAKVRSALDSFMEAPEEANGIEESEAKVPSPKVAVSRVFKVKNNSLNYF